MNLLEKISSYNLVTNLIPGTVLTESLRGIGIPLVGSEKLATWLVLSYSLGLVSSRLGSLIAEPIAKRVGGFSDNTYTEFVLASQQDAKLDVLVETGNGYRTILGACLLFAFVLISNFLIPIEAKNSLKYAIICLTVILVIFGLSYKKQNSYITRRIERIRDDTT